MITHRFNSSADVATRFPSVADTIRSNREREEARLSEFVTRIKTGARPLNLLNCLRVLRWDHWLHEETSAEATYRQQAMFAEQRVALAQVLGEIAASRNKSAKIALPPVLKGLATLPNLRAAVPAHQNEVKKAREANKHRRDYHIEVNWRRCAESLLSKLYREIGEPVVHHPRVTAWTRALDWLITNTHVVGMDAEVIEEWVREEGRVKKSTPLTVELARLDREKAHVQILKHIRDDIKRIAEECIRTVWCSEQVEGDSAEVSRVLMWTIRDAWTTAGGLARFCTKLLIPLPDIVFSLASIREKLHELVDLVFDRIVDANAKSQIEGELPCAVNWPKAADKEPAKFVFVCEVKKTAPTGRTAKGVQKLLTQYPLGLRKDDLEDSCLRGLINLTKNDREWEAAFARPGRRSRSGYKFRSLFDAIVELRTPAAALKGKKA